jgi:hypothetical protein
MKVGDLCKVTKANTHQISQEGDLVIVTKYVRHFPREDSMYVEGINLKTLKFHHYRKSDIEVINEKNSII